MDQSRLLPPRLERQAGLAWEKLSKRSQASAAVRREEGEAIEVRRRFLEALRRRAGARIRRQREAQILASGLGQQVDEDARQPVVLGTLWSEHA